MNTNTLDKQFYLGTHLCREPMPPMPELKADMELLKKNGFSLIKLQEHWQVDEPAEGRYDFSRYEELIEHAAKLDLGIYLGLTCEQAPRWLFEKHPDCRMVGIDGYPINYIAATTLPADGKPGPCFDHPGALADQTRFITELVRTLGRFENIVVWNTWQEIGYWAEGLVGRSVCYCPYTIASFRRWLEKKHGDLDELNRRWNTRFADWDSVFPDNIRTRRNATPHAAEFAYFMANVQIADVLKNRAEAICDADPHRRPVFAHRGSPELGSAADWTYARCQDFLGSSVYPMWTVFEPWDDGSLRNASRYERHSSLLQEMWGSLALRFDYLRSCNRVGAPVWAAEFQGGPVSTGLHKGRVPSAADIRRWMLTAVASGVSAISFWVTRAEIMAPETNGFSLLDSTGVTTERFAEAARVGTALAKHPELFAQSNLESPRVGIIVDESNSRLCNTLDGAVEHLTYSMCGWHRMFWDRGISAGFVDAREIGSGAEDGYSLLVLPFPLSVSEELVQRLEVFVSAGGYLVSEACPGRLNEYAYANRGELSPAAARLFGVAHDSITMVNEPGDGARWMPAERSWGEYASYAPLIGEGIFDGAKASPAFYVQTFSANDATTILSSGGKSTGVVRRVGKGGAMLIGTLLGHQGNAYRGPENPEIVARILAWSQVPGADEKKGAALTAKPPRLLLRKRKTDGAEAWLFTNIRDVPVCESVDVTGFRHVEDLLEGEIERNGDTVELEVESLDVRALILSR